MTLSTALPQTPSPSTPSPPPLPPLEEPDGREAFYRLCVTLADTTSQAMNDIRIVMQRTQSLPPEDIAVWTGAHAAEVALDAFLDVWKEREKTRESRSRGPRYAAPDRAAPEEDYVIQ